ncbi:hypothetical protein TIFTF001_054181 [Ficus carica]|uniref:Uncharacterized protein n=1 Tax=Ficus carica TaxID=3494 RepID=A0AA88EC64_FICCA|nr:hypothetical protein TIFTF001_054180 [Ficus carica]GMN72044.1 hypothetical protein TIFTF001_054181 [Ficus carica]
MGPNSESREPQELGVCKDRCWVLLGHLLSMLGPTRAPPFGQYPVMGPDSVVREPQELGVYKDRCWVLLGHLLSMLGHARAPPFVKYSVMGPDFVVREPQELFARADVRLFARADIGSCSSTSFRSILGHGTWFRGPETIGVVCKCRFWVLLGHLFSVSTRSWDMTPWSGNHRSRLQGQMLGCLQGQMSCLQGQILGPARAPPFGQYPVIGPNSVVREPQELSTRADVWLGHLLWLAWIFHWIDPSPTLVGVQHGDLSQWSAKGKNSTPEVVVIQHSSRGSSTRVTGKFYPGQQALFPRKFNPGHGEVLPGSSMVPEEVLPGSRGSSTRVKHDSRGSSTRVTRKFYPGQQVWLPGKFRPGQAWFPGKFYPGQACPPTLRSPGVL